MFEQTGRHGFLGGEEGGVDGGVRLYQRIGRIGDVISHRAVVSINHHLDGVADIVDLSVHWFRVRVAVADGIGILNPIELAIHNRQIGISVIAQEGSHRAHPLLYAPVEHQPGVCVKVLAQQNIGVGQAKSEGEPLQVGIERNAAGPFVKGVHVLFAARVVEFLNASSDEYVVVRQFAIVDFWTVNRQRHRNRWRQVFHPKLRQPFRRDLIDWVHHYAEAVCELQMLIDPRDRLQLGLIQFTRSQDHLTIIAINPVAVNIQVGEPVV